MIFILKRLEKTSLFLYCSINNKGEWYIYMEQFIRPRLKDLSQGARIAYVRGLRGMTQDELSGN